MSQSLRATCRGTPALSLKILGFVKFPFFSTHFPILWRFSVEETRIIAGEGKGKGKGRTRGRGGRGQEGGGERGGVLVGYSRFNSLGRFSKENNNNNNVFVVSLFCAGQLR